MSDEPVAGHYKTRLTKGGPMVPVKLYFGLPVIDGEEQDRSPRWCAIVDGETDRLEKGDDGYQCRVALDPMKYWPFCGRYPISEADYRYMLDKGKWAKEWAPHRPEADPHKKIDVRGPSVF
jgi:hypothetical protein